jgi:hypothetical protein
MSARNTAAIDLRSAPFNRSAVEQVLENLRQALRVLELVPSSETDLTPHPLVIVRAEIENARRYLRHLRVVDSDDSRPVSCAPLLEVA